jgi:hypothetical protein
VIPKLLEGLSDEKRLNYFHKFLPYSQELTKDQITGLSIATDTIKVLGELIRDLNKKRYVPAK